MHRHTYVDDIARIVITGGFHDLSHGHVGQGPRAVAVNGLNVGRQLAVKP